MVRAGRVLADMPAPAPAEHNFGVRALDELLEKPHRALRLGARVAVTSRHSISLSLVCLAELRDVLGDRALPRIIHDDTSGGHSDVAFAVPAMAAVPRRCALVIDERRGVDAARRDDEARHVAWINRAAVRARREVVDLLRLRSLLRLLGLGLRHGGLFRRLLGCTNHGPVLRLFGANMMSCVGRMEPAAEDPQAAIT